MTKTIEEMVQELDEKFHGFKTFIINRWGFFKKSNYKTKKDDRFQLQWNIQGSKRVELVICTLKRIGISFMCATKEDCITKAHDYFITQGNEL
jgi:hypothetical protein